MDIFGRRKSYRNDNGELDLQNSIMINSCGYQEFNDTDIETLRAHGRIDYQLIYVIKGKGTFFINNKFVELEEGKFLIYKPKDIQNYKYYSKDKTAVYWVHFTGKSCDEILNRLSIIDDRNYYFVGVDSKSIEILDKIIYELQIKEKIYIEICNAYLMEFLCNLGRLKARFLEGKQNNRSLPIQNIMSVMHREYSKNHDLEYFASLCNLSKYRFIHSFKEYSGISPINYIIKIRIEKAKELLLSSSLNISEISSLVGYENSMYFSRLFKKNNGMSPTEYRKKNHNSNNIKVTIPL